jgi:hypothetical protein
MGVVNTTYTFSGTDTITSSKLNNIIDDTTFTSDAIQGDTLQVVSPGKLAVNAGGVTSNELASGAVTQAKLGANVAGNGPAFSAYLNASQSISNNNSNTIAQLNAKTIDTASCFNTSTYRFTPNVAGYYQINVSAQIDVNGMGVLGTTFVALVKNNNEVRFDVSILANTSPTSHQASGSVLIYMNGTTDYLRIICNLNGGTATNAIIAGGSGRTYMSGFLARSA